MNGIAEMPGSTALDSSNHGDVLASIKILGTTKEKLADGCVRKYVNMRYHFCK